MAISVTTAKNILRSLVLGGSIGQGGVYLALLTRLPDDPNHTTNNASTGYQEVPSSVTGYLDGVSVTTATGYSRLLIGQNGNSSTGVGNIAFFPSEASWDNVNQYTYLRNTNDGIQMHNILPEGELPRRDQAGTQPNYWSVVGFGLFNAATGGTMLGYGPLVDADGYVLETPVTITEGSVPIFYKDGLTFIIADQSPPERE